MTNINKDHKTNIFKLIDYASGFLYIGSTTQRLSKRLKEHKNKTKRSNSHMYVTFNEIGRENVVFILLDCIKCENKKEQLRLEDKIICEHKEDEKCLSFIPLLTELF